jgi:hypothetical protein
MIGRKLGRLDGRRGRGRRRRESREGFGTGRGIWGIWIFEQGSLPGFLVGEIRMYGVS